jgi:hypothetical protein
MTRRTAFLVLVTFVGGFLGGMVGGQVLGPGRAEAQAPAEQALTKTALVEWLKGADLSVRSLTAPKVTTAALEVPQEKCLASAAACAEPGVPKTTVTNQGISVASTRLVNNAAAPAKWATLGFVDGDKNLKLEMADAVSERYSSMEVLPKAVQMLEFRVKGMSRASLGVDHAGRAFLEVKKDQMKELTPKK